MAVKIQTIQNFLGFGDGLKRGEYYYSQGMGCSREGIKPNWVMIKSIDNGTLAELQLIKWFDQRKEAGSIYIYAVAYDGKIFKVEWPGNDWTLARTPTTNNDGNGLIVDQKNRVLYAQAQYLGMYDGTTWTDNWKDFVVDIGNKWRPMDLYEDWVVMGNKNKIALLNITDDSFNANAFNLSDEFEIVALKSGKNGVLIGANIGSRSALVLWDCQATRSIAPWTWIEGNISGIAKYEGQWIVSVGNEIFITNGYTQRYLITPVDLRIQDSDFGPYYPSGMLVRNFYLFINGGWDSLSRKKTGLWIYNLRTQLWEFCSPSNFCLRHVTPGALFIDNKWIFYASYQTDLPNKIYIEKIWNSAPSKSFYISPPLGVGDNQKIAEGLILNLGFDLADYTDKTLPNWKIIAGIYDFKKPLWKYGRTTAASTEANKLKIDGTYYSADVGDEVTILKGANASEIRHIIAITGKGTVDEVWTLDSDLPNLTEQDVFLNICPFRKIGEWTINNYPIKNYYYFPIKNLASGRKFLIKVYFKVANLTPELHSLSFIYDDLGIL